MGGNDEREAGEGIDKARKKGRGSNMAGVNDEKDAREGINRIRKKGRRWIMAGGKDERKAKEEIEKARKKFREGSRMEVLQEKRQKDIERPETHGLRSKNKDTTPI